MDGSRLLLMGIQSDRKSDLITLWTKSPETAKLEWSERVYLMS